MVSPNLSYISTGHKADIISAETYYCKLVYFKPDKLSRTAWRTGASTFKYYFVFLVKIRSDKKLNQLTNKTTTRYILLKLITLCSQLLQYPGRVTRLTSEGAHCLNTSREKPPLIIPGVAKRTHGPGELIRERSKVQTAIQPRHGFKYFNKSNHRLFHPFFSEQRLNNYYHVWSQMRYV